MTANEGFLISKEGWNAIHRRLSALEAPDISRTRQPGIEAIRRRCVIAAPVDTELDYIMVQEVRYKDSVPKPCPDSGEPCDVVFVGKAFKAWPEIPATVADFDGLDIAVGERMKSDTDVFTVWTVDRRPLIEKPTSTATEPDYVVILATHSLGGANPATGSPGNGLATLDEDFELLVRKVKFDRSLNPPAFAFKGEAMTANTYFNCPSSAYHRYIGFNRNTPNHANMMVFRMEKALGLWIVDQKPLLETGDTPSGTAGTCTAVVT